MHETLELPSRQAAAAGNRDRAVGWHTGAVGRKSDDVVAESIFRSVWRRWYSYIDGFGTLSPLVLALAVGGLLLVGQVAWADTITLWSTVWIVVIAAMVSALAAVVEVLRDRTDWLRAIYSVPRVDVKKVDPITVTSGAQVSSKRMRVMVNNRSSTAHSFAATVVGTDGVSGPEVPWPVAWRHGSGREHRLFPGDKEMLDIAGVRTWPSMQSPVLELFLADQHTAPDSLLSSGVSRI